MQRYPMTVNGAQQLREELNHLKFVERPRMSEVIAEARAHGDLKENAEYHAAKEEQLFMETRLHVIENRLAHAEIIDVAQLPKNGRVVFATTVILINLSNDKTVQYKIVGEDEADLKLGMISVSSPIARAMIGKMEGDIVLVQTPMGEVEYEVKEVQYIP